MQIDCNVEDIDAAARFWAAALACPVDLDHPGSRDNYRQLTTPPGQPMIQLQRVEHESRVHLDIETDDIDAEVARLEKLGATIFKRLDRLGGDAGAERPALLRGARATAGLCRKREPLEIGWADAGFIDESRTFSPWLLGFAETLSPIYAGDLDLDGPAPRDPKLLALVRPAPNSAGLPTHDPLHCAQFDAPHPELPWWITAAAEPTRSAPPGPSPLARRAHTAIATAIAAH